MALFHVRIHYVGGTQRTRKVAWFSGIEARSVADAIKQARAKLTATRKRVVDRIVDIDARKSVREAT